METGRCAHRWPGDHQLLVVPQDLQFGRMLPCRQFHDRRGCIRRDSVWGRQWPSSREMHSCASEAPAGTTGRFLPSRKTRLRDQDECHDEFDIGHRLGATGVAEGAGDDVRAMRWSSTAQEVIKRATEGRRRLCANDLTGGVIRPGQSRRSRGTAPMRQSWWRLDFRRPQGTATDSVTGTTTSQRGNQLSHSVKRQRKDRADAENSGRRNRHVNGNRSQTHTVTTAVSRMRHTVTPT